MQYRKLGTTGWDVSILGFGAMRLPTMENDPSKINEPEAIRMIRHAVDNGVNYVDTAYMYHNGDSERLVGKALKDGYREKVHLTTKLPVRMMQKKEDADRILDDQLTKLDVDHVDIYLFHGLNKDQWKMVQDWKLLDWMEKQIADGKIGRVGFSFHDEYEVFEQIITGYDNWVIAQILYNFMDWKVQAGQRGVKLAASRNVPIVVMEPLRGGLLAREAPQSVKEMWASARRHQEPVEWAFQWVWSQPEVAIALSGMNAFEQVEQNLKIASSVKLHSMSADELKLIDKIRDAYRGLRPVKCSNCKYCMPCPHGVDIPGVFQIYDDSVMYGDPNIGKFRYNGPFGIDQNMRADKCIECGECLPKCPMQIAIPDQLKVAHAAMYMENPPQRH
jgi:predicted aldo/keto reductase-like oxidoreductase